PEPYKTLTRASLTRCSPIRKRHCDHRAATRAGRADVDRAAVAVRDLAHDREPQTGALARRPLDAVEALEHLPALVGGNTRPVVLDLEERLAVAAARAQRHLAAPL